MNTNNTNPSYHVDVTYRYGCSWDLTPEQKLAVGIIEDALDEIRQKSRYAKSSAYFLCDENALGFWLAVAGIENEKVAEYCRKIGRAFFDQSLSSDMVVQLWKKANPRKTSIGEPVFTLKDGTEISKLELVEQSGLSQEVLAQRLRKYPLVSLELLILPTWQWKLIDKKEYMRKPDRADHELDDEKSIQVG